MIYLILGLIVVLILQVLWEQNDNKNLRMGMIEEILRLHTLLIKKGVVTPEEIESIKPWEIESYMQSRPTGFKVFKKGEHDE